VQVRLDLFPKDDLIVNYRNIFTGKGSEDVLLHMLYDLGIFEETQNEEDVVLKNYGIRLIRILGGGEVSRETIREFIKRLVMQPLKETKEEGEQYGT
jgi:hypothetical protein